MEKTQFHTLTPVTEPEALEWLRGLTINAPMPADVMWRLAQALRAVDQRLQAHERALIAAATANVEAAH